jgi:[ribosomal protein S5]-alanine N-acetyltransferase
MLINDMDTERLIIREFGAEDFDSVHLYASKPEVTKYLPFGPNSEKETRMFLQKAMDYKRQNPRNDYEFAVVLKKDNTLIGGCGIYITDTSNKEGSIGYCFDNQFWRNGYASESANALIRFGFESLKLHRIFATCHPENIGSAKVLERVGMVKEGCLREHKFQKGKWRDSFIFSILDHEYNTNAERLISYHFM